MADRKNQPRCEECSHPKSFHRDGTSCWALGCDCELWVAPPEETPAEDSVILSEVP